MEQKQKEIDLGKVVEVLKDSKKPIGMATGVTTLIAIIYCIFATPIFTAKTIINPPKLSDAGSGILFQALGGLAGLTGGGGFLNQKTDADITMAILKTDSIKNIVVKQLDLQKKFGNKDIELTRRSLDEMIKFIPDMKSGFLEIDVDNSDPQFAAAVASYYPTALGQMLSNIAYGRSNVKYQFYKSQLASVESAMNAAEDDLKAFAESNGFIAGQQVQIVAGLSAQLQAQLIVAQAQLQSMSMYAAPGNPDYQKLESQIAGYKAQLDNMNVSGSPDPIGIPASLAPELAKKYANLMREFSLRQEVYRIIAKQYEAHRLDLLSELVPVGIQVIDPAQVPLHKSKPKRLKIVVGGFLIGLLVSCLFFIIQNRKKIIVEIKS